MSKTTTHLVLISLSIAATTAVAQPTEPPPTPPAEPPAAEPAPAPEPTPPVPDPAPVAPPPSVDKTPDLSAGKVEASAEAKPKKIPLELKPGGYVHFDSRRFLTESEAHDMTIRRLRFKLDGNATKYFKFRTLIDFAGSKLVVDDAWAEAVLRPELSIRAGKDKSQFGIERLQSAAGLVFIERAYPTQISPNRDIGIWLRGDVAGGFVHYAVGIVDGVADNAVLEGEGDDELEYNLHVLVSPFAKKKELGDLGFGTATTFGRTQNAQATPGVTNYKSVGQATIFKHAAGMDADTTAITAGYRSRIAAHGYYYRGPFGVLAEYVRDNEPVAFMGSHELLKHDAWQIQTSVAVTPGDKPTYRSIKPKKSLDPEKGTWGAVEVAARYTELRFDPDAFEAGIVKASNSVESAREFTLGGNWYFNEYLKLQLNYSLTKFESHDPATAFPDEHVIATRLQASI